MTPTSRPLNYIRVKLERTASDEVKLNATHERQFDQLEAYSPLPAGARVLDVACGTGTWAAALAVHGLRVHCTDLQPDFLRAARETTRKSGHDLTAVQGDAVALPYRDNIFDAVTMLSVLEHVPRWSVMVSEGLRVLKPGGTLWLTTTNRSCPWTDEISGFPMFPWYPAALKERVMSWVQENQPWRIGHSPAPAVHWFTYDELQWHLESLGCVETATFVDHHRIEGHNWRRVALEALRASKLLRESFWHVHAGVSLMTRKGMPRSAPRAVSKELVRTDIQPAPTDGIAELQDTLACPRCISPLDFRPPGELHCAVCQVNFPVHDDIPRMMESLARPVAAAAYG
jgi:SAM-dependent methyltransferase/uncharacterized protein YbaR (Trm112 family)